MRYNVDYICKKLWEIEKEYQLTNKEIREVMIWQNIRMDVYYEITKQVGIFYEPHRYNFQKIEKAKELLNIIKNSLTNNPLLGRYEKEYLIFDHERKILLNGEFCDIYTKYIVDQLGDNKVDIIEKSYNGKHLTKRKSNIKYDDIIKIKSGIYKIFNKSILNNNEKQFIDCVQDKLNQTFNISIDLIGIIEKRLHAYKVRLNFYDKLIKKRKPKCIFIVVSYGKSEIIQAAKDNNVKVIEIQHGVISRYHLGYSYPNDYKLSYFPDYLLVFGEYWKSAAHYPLPEKNIIPLGFQYFNENKKKYNNTKKNEQQVLFISQGVIGKELSDICFDFASKNKKYNIIFKLHPGEFNDWKQKYKNLLLAKEKYGVTIVCDTNKTLYEYFAESKYIIGVFSTAIYEGLAFGCKTILIDLPGIEYMNDLIENNIVAVAKNSQEIVNCLKEFNAIEYDESFFFKKNVEINKAINIIINESKNSINKDR